ANLNILGIASGIFSPLPPAPNATLVLSRGSVLQNGGIMMLTDGSQISADALPQSQLGIAPGALMDATNSLVQGSSTNHLIIDNSGIIRVDGGTLRFAKGIDWQCSGGSGEFNAGNSAAFILFDSSFQVPAAVTDRFTGPGTNRWTAGGAIDGTAEVSGNLEVTAAVSGAGTVHVLG